MCQVVTKKEKVILMGLLIILNLIMRIPSIPHEKGFDSFFIHSLANSVSNFGYANWWLHWSSVIGSYPYSYASAVPFLISGISQISGLIGIEMEYAILLFSLALGIFSIFSSFILAGMLTNKFMFKYFVALLFSLSQGILVFTTWEPSSRGPFMIFLPFALFLLLKNTFVITKKTVLLIIILAFLASIHHYFVFMFAFLGIYIFLKVVSLKFTYIHKKIDESHINYVFLSVFLIMILLPFFTRFMIDSGSRYGWIIDAFVVSSRYLGPAIFLSISGIIYMIFKINKTVNEWYMMLVALVLFPFIYNITYGIYIILLFAVIFAATALNNVFNAMRKSRILNLSFIFLILSIVIFSSFYNHYHTGRYSDTWYMKESTYELSEWAYNYIPENSHGFGYGYEIPRLFATSNGHPVIPRGGALDMTNSFIDASSLEIVKVSPTSKYFYFEGFYMDQNNVNIPGTVNWILENSIDYKGVVPILDRYDFSYFFMAEYYNSGIGASSIRSTKDSFYDNGVVSIWLI
ncbi:hypothetical protein [uncultured Methanolobus sp.]|uniref:hypothetical protein n=1 Tax=uncultured Methanolobus sp. TaxID=218300 RepID=UPI0029C769D1|nr:hypothetical protein [uncultured Methanolobus sp.]